MKLKNIVWRNFKSFSNIPTEINFDDNSSLNLVLGNNGTGKTSISEVITYSLYGKIENFKNSEIPNRINKNFYSKITVDCDGHEVIIERGLAPAIFAVKIDGESVDTAGKNNVQAMLEDIYFKIPYSVFINSLVLSIDDFRSLVDLSAVDKRNIIDKIFGFTLYNKLTKCIKEDLKDLTTDISSNEGSIQTSTNYIANYVRQINEISENEVSQNELDELKQKIKEIETVNEKNNEIIQKIQSLKNDLQTSTYEKSSEYQEYAHRIKDIDKKIALIDSGKCPTCGSSLETDDFKQERVNLLTEREECVSGQEGIKKILLDVKKKLDALDKRERKTKNEMSTSNLVELKSNLKYKSSIKDSNVEPLKKLKSEMDENLTKLNDEHDNLIKEKKVLDTMLVLFGEDGIKKYITSQYTPIINKIISDVINYMELNYSIEFDDNFNSTITTGGYRVNYSTLSTGEKKRIDFACIISIIKFLKMQLGELNLLFIDELFSNIDISGVSDMIELLKGLCEEMNLNIFLIHHAQLEGIVFDKIYKTSKPDGFSRLDISNG
jgi:DNA repair exonuclease SbcCD ATPase subunit